MDVPKSLPESLDVEITNDDLPLINGLDEDKLGRFFSNPWQCALAHAVNRAFGLQTPFHGLQTPFSKATVGVTVGVQTLWVRDKEREVKYSSNQSFTFERFYDMYMASQKGEKVSFKMTFQQVVEED